MLASTDGPATALALLWHHAGPSPFAWHVCTFVSSHTGMMAASAWSRLPLPPGSSETKADKICQESASPTLMTTSRSRQDALLCT